VVSVTSVAMILVVSVTSVAMILVASVTSVAVRGVPVTSVAMLSGSAWRLRG
jgi:hypothetical protein